MGISGVRSVRRRWLTNLAWVATLAVLLTTGQASAARAGESAPIGLVTAAPAGTPTVSAADEIANAITNEGRGAHADSFGGLTMDPRSRTVTLYATDADRGKQLRAVAESRVSALTRAQVRVEVRTARHSLRDLEAARSQLRRIVNQWKTSGVEVYTIAIHPETGSMVAGTNAPAQAERLARALPVDALGSGVSTTELAFEPGSQPQSLSRYEDVPPHAGGIHLRRRGQTGSTCSSAFAVAQRGNTFLVTAAHCYNRGDEILTGGGGRRIGNIVGWQWRNDAATIATNAWSGVWVNNTSWTHYRDSAWTYSGEVCQSGVATNQTCGIWVTHAYYEWGGTVGVRACAPPGYTAVRHGDSGGPVYNWWGDGKLQSRGIVSAGDTPTAVGYRCLLFTETPRMLREWSAGTAPVTLLTRP